MKAECENCGEFTEINENGLCVPCHDDCEELTGEEC
jgi:hypothetical protein